MKSGDTYRFTLSWQADTEERILAGEFLNKLGNRKSKLIIQLICDYIAENPEAVNPQETLKFIVNTTPTGDKLAEMVRSMIQSELAGTSVSQPSDGSPSNTESKKTSLDADAGIDDMLGNLDLWDI